MNFYPFIVLHDHGEPFAVRVKNIVRFENREITTNDSGELVSELVDESFEELHDLIRLSCTVSMNDLIAEIDGE